MEKYSILAINPGSTSTKIAIFENDESVFEETLRHSSDEIGHYETIFDQYDFRKNVILKMLKDKGISLENLSAVVGRGGLLKPIKGGTYATSKTMIDDLRVGVLGEHASNLGGILASEIASSYGIPSYIVDPVVVDEMQDLARVSGMPELDRKSIFHALNQKAVARRAASEMGKAYGQCNFIVAHMGGGVSVGAHVGGKVVDVNNALDGQGPFSPERSGGVPAGDLARMCFSGNYTLTDIKKKLKGSGGLVAYLDTNDARTVSERVGKGDKEAETIYRAMAYQISKEIGSCAAVLKGEIDGIILTGGIAYDKEFVGWIKENIDFLGKVIVYPGEDEMKALAEGALRVLTDQEVALEY